MVNNQRYYEQVGEAHRKDFSQFFTPLPVARFMVEWVLASGKPCLYDPAFGLGAFHQSVPDAMQLCFSASEVDPKIIGYWQRINKQGKNGITVEDYLLSWGKRHQNIVCNPPYMRFQKFLNRGAVFGDFQSHLGVKLSGYTNTASAFLLKSLSELDGSGRLAYIMPLEFLNTGYGKFVKKRLIEGGHLTAIIQLQCEKEVFPDAITSVGIILYDSAAHYASVNFYSVNSLDELNTVLSQKPVSTIALNNLDPDVKWLPYFQESISLRHEHLLKLDYYGRFSRGIATGANKFFVLRPSGARTKRLNSSEFLPCITRSSQITKTVFHQEDLAALIHNDAPILLFSVLGKLSEQAQKYIKYGEEQGFNTRFLTKQRKPWFKTESRQPAPILFGVFSRGSYKIILNKSNALNLTCFHGFQPNLPGQQYVEPLFLYLASNAGRKIISLSRRTYGDSLDKFEPNDLNGAYVPKPDFLERIPVEQVKAAIQQIEETETVPESIEILFEELLCPTKP